METNSPAKLRHPETDLHISPYGARHHSPYADRWSLDGAEAVLLLRAVITNGDMDAYWAFHLEREYERTHATRYPGQLALAA